MVDSYSRFNKIYGLDDRTMESVIKAIRQYTADCVSVNEFGYIDIKKIRSDAGTQFTSMEFQELCRDECINLSLASPKKQAKNHFAECTWQTVNNMARSMIYMHDYHHQSFFMVPNHVLVIFVSLDAPVS
jgi:transposase InsO family protein